MELEPPVAKKPRSKQKCLKEWEESDVFKLISLVETEPCLWDASVDGYHNRTIRDFAWQNISENMGSTYSLPEITTKWTNLRIQYRGYAARAKTKSGQGTVEIPKWRYFNAMAFIGRAEDLQVQSTISNLNVNNESDNSVDTESSTAATPPASTPTNSRRTQAANQQSVATHIAETMRDAVNVMKERRENITDPNLSFSNYILSELRTLNNGEAASVRKKVTLFFLQCLEEERNKSN